MRNRRCLTAAAVLALGTVACLEAAPGALAAAPGVFSVRDYGAVGDGVTDDLPAVLKALGALQAAGSGSLYFPKGTYRISDRIEFANGPNQTRIYGDGDDSILQGDTTKLEALFYLRDISGIAIDHLRLEGAHVFNKITNVGAGILLLRATGTQIHSCTLAGIGTGVQEDAGASGTVFTNNRILDWGDVGYFVEGHTTVENNQFIQTDPSPEDFANTSSHGMYIHSGAQSVVVRGNLITGVKKYGIQVYGRQGDTLTDGILIQGNRFANNASDLVAYSETEGPVYQNITVNGNTFRDTRGPSVYMGKGTNLEVSDNLFVNGGGQDSFVIRMGSWDSGSAVKDGRVLRNTILRTSSAKSTGIDVEAATTDNVTVQDNWIAMDGKYGVYVRFASDVTIADNVIWMPPGAGTDFADGIELDENAFNVQITGNDVYGTGIGHAAGVFALPYPQGSSGMIAGNRFFGAPLTPGPLQVDGNVIQPLTGQPVTLFALEDPGSAGQSATTTRQIRVVIEGGADAVGWLLSESEVRMPKADDPGWQSAMPATFTLSDRAGVKRVILWRKLADGTVSDRPEVAVIELMPTAVDTGAAAGG